MPLLLRAAQESDTPKLGIIGRDAFRDSLSRSLFPPHLASKSETGDPGLDEAQWRDVRVLRRMREGKPTFVVVDVTEGESEGENVVGFAQWELPSCSTAPASHAAAEAEKDALPASLDRDSLQELYAALETETKKALGPDGHSKMWYLMLLAIDPNQQRRGIGRMLVNHGLELAARDRKDVYLVATPAGRGLYHSLGFRDIGESVDLCGTPHYSMLWSVPDAVVS